MNGDFERRRNDYAEGSPIDFLRRAADLWYDVGYDADQTLFYESLDFRGRPRKNVDRRIRTQFRQVYTAIRSAGLLSRPEAAKTAAAVRRRLWRDYRLDDGGFIALVDVDGAPKSSVVDLYDQAFALLMESAWIKAGGDRRGAERLLDFLARRMHAGNYDEGAQGFVEALPVDVGAPRRQNPHMHLLEALLRLIQADPKGPLADRAAETAQAIFSLFRRRFFRDGVIREYFSWDFGSAGAKLDEVTEPGHAAEWIFLSKLYDEVVGGASSVSYRRKLWRALGGMKRPDGFLYDQTTPDGKATVTTARTWPQCELLRATSIMSVSEAADRWRDLRKGYLSTTPDGAWRDRLDPKGRNVAQDVPASTHYHVLEAADFFSRAAATTRG